MRTVLLLLLAFFAPLFAATPTVDKVSGVASASVGAIGPTAFASCGSITGGAAFAHGPPPEFAILVDTTKAGSAAKHFVLPCNGSGYDADVDWGDGGAHTTLTGSPGNVDHTYAGDGTYTVKIKENSVGGFPTIYFNGGGDCLKLMQISQWGTNTWGTDIREAFYGCANLTITATDGATAKTGNIQLWADTFCNCFAITFFPLLDSHSGTSFDTTWGGCINLGPTFPLMDFSAATVIRHAWQYNYCLTSFPAINTGNVLDLNSAWMTCIALTHFPALDTSKVTNFNSAWKQCHALLDFPALDTGLGTDFGATWQECESITSFPSLNVSNGTNFALTWAVSTGLNGSTFPTLNMRKMTDGTNCFGFGVALSTASYSNLINDLGTYNTNTGVTFNGGNSHYNAGAVTAHDTLTVTRTWTITDGGTP